MPSTAPRESAPTVTGHLPGSVTSFVGRRAELASARRSLGESRLVTLTGAGGVGKTRLALEVAERSRRAFADGVWMVDLAGLGDESRLAQTVLSALQVRDQSARSADEQLIDHLRDRHALIVLDNCEHLLGGCARLVTTLLSEAPRLRVLATSRESLTIPAEQVLDVPPLTTPDPSQPTSLGDLARYEAVSLFMARATAVRPGFVVTRENGEAVAHLCARLDGLPLAIELAATRLRSLSVGELVDRLDDRFGLLTRGSRAALPRQQTLRALIDWSHDLCSAEEQQLWARLSVFPASFDVAAAEDVCADEGMGRGAVVALLDQLVAKSVIRASTAAPARYRMLVSIREYGAERLTTDERERLRRRHRDHYAGRARRMVDGWCGPGQVALLGRAREDHPNFRAALTWSMRDPAEALAGAAMASALRYHWVVGGFLGEGRGWLEQALAIVPRRSRERGEASWVAAWICLVQGDGAAGRAMLDECRPIAARLDDRAMSAHAEQWTGIAEFFGGDPYAAVPRFERALEGHRAAGDIGSELFTLFQLGVALAFVPGGEARAREACAEARRLSEHHGDEWVWAYALAIDGIACHRLGDAAEATRLARDAVAIEADFQDGIAAGLAIEVLAWSAPGAPMTARLLGAAAAVWRAFGTSVAAFGPGISSESRAAADRARDALGPQRHDALFAETAGLPLDRAIAFALHGDVEPSEAGPLSPRELEVAGLVADGLSNKAIAERLTLSPRTVDGHLERIFDKLGVSSRARVAAWVAGGSAEPRATRGR